MGGLMGAYGGTMGAPRPYQNPGFRPADPGQTLVGNPDPTTNPGYVLVNGRWVPNDAYQNMYGSSATPGPGHQNYLDSLALQQQQLLSQQEQEAFRQQQEAAQFGLTDAQARARDAAAGRNLSQIATENLMGIDFGQPRPSGGPFGFSGGGGFGGGGFGAGFGGGGGLPPQVGLGGGGSIGVPGIGGGGGLGSTYFDQAFARAKDRIGNSGRAALNALQNAYTGRGLAGSGMEEAGAAGLIGNLGAGQAQAATDVLGQELGLGADLAKTAYTGGITQRGQDIGALLGARGQDIAARNALLGLQSGLFGNMVRGLY